MFFEYVWHHAQAWSQDQFLLIFEKERGPPQGCEQEQLAAEITAVFGFLLLFHGRTLLMHKQNDFGILELLNENPLLSLKKQNKQILRQFKTRQPKKKKTRSFFINYRRKRWLFFNQLIKTSHISYLSCDDVTCPPLALRK